MTRTYTYTEKAIALAGIFQAAKLVQSIARQGIANSAWLTTACHSLFETDPNSVADVYEGEQNLATGIRTLITQLNDAKNRDIELTTYVVSILKLEQTLAKNPDVLAALGKDIDTLKDRRDSFDLADNTLYIQLARIYQDNISQLSPRILVKGEAMHLENPDNAAKVRMGLLAGIRSAMLWSQCGGNKWALLFKRKNFIEAAENLLR